MRKNKHTGFTLIELIVVVVVLGVLAAMALMQYTKTVEIQRYRSHKRNLIQLKGELEAYRYKNKEYPPFNLNEFDLYDDDIFIYSYTRQTPTTFFIVTSRGNPSIYNCNIEQDFSYPECSGTLPE